MSSKSLKGKGKFEKNMGEEKEKKQSISNRYKFSSLYLQKFITPDELFESLATSEKISLYGNG